MSPAASAVRVFLDANVLFSSAKSAVAIRALLVALVDAGHVLVADTYVVEEARRNLSSKGPAALRDFDALLAGVEVASFRRAQLLPAVAARLPEKDRPVLAAAVRLRCDALVTGDARHFGALYGQVCQGVAVHSPRSLAEWVWR